MDKGELLQVTQKTPYLIKKIIGIAVWIIVISILIGITILFILGERNYLADIIIIMVGLFLLFLVAPFALIRRVKIYEKGIVPACPPYKELFQKKEYFIPYHRMVDIYSNGRNQLTFKLDNGELSEISSNDVDKVTFEKLLEIKNKFYWYTSNNKKIDKILLDGTDPWEKYGYPKK